MGNITPQALPRVYTEAQKAHKREYQLHYNEVNKTRLRPLQRVRNQKYYQLHKEEIRAHNHQYYLTHKEEHRIQNKLWVANHRESVNLSGREYQARLRLRVLRHYSPSLSCSKCGNNDIRVLNIDHVNGGGGKIRKELGYFRELVRIVKANFPSGFQVLCANCHMVKDRRFNPLLVRLVGGQT